MSSRPRTPHRRHPSSLDIHTSPPTHFASPNSRRSSTVFSPRSPHSPVSHRFSRGSHEDDTVMDISAIGGGGDGLGNLADELADMDEWDGDEEDGDGLDEGVSELVQSNGHADVDKTRDSGIDVSSSPLTLTADTTLARKTGSGMLEPGSRLSPVQKQKQSRHRRQYSEYDGSDYGESDLEEAPLISPALEARMAGIESLARRGMETNGSAEDAIVERVVERLRDLGSQAGVEGGATRLATAHSAVATHLAHQTRQLASITTALVSPLAPPPPPDLIDELLPLLAPTVASLAELHPSGTSLQAIHTLARSTADLIQNLSYLADTLQMSRQTTTTAARRLRTVREAMAEWKRESEVREEGVRWIERGGWEERLKGREAGRTCERVVGGFEEVCERWRERLVGQLGVEVVA